MKSHFQFSKKQRSGIFLLIAIIVLLQSIFIIKNNREAEPFIVNDELIKFNNEVDSLRLLAEEKTKPKIYPFNPNYLTDYKGYTLGMSNEEIDRLHSYRAKNKWVNSAKEFQNITKVSDSLLNEISEYFKFPEWVSSRNSNTSTYKNVYDNDKPKSYNQKIDLNLATASQLKKVYGIGEKLSERIIAYRNKSNGGFIADNELFEVYGLEEEVIERIKHDFTVKTPRAIEKINLNTATRDDLVTVKYIDYEVAHKIIEERNLREGFKSLEELTKVEDFPIHKIEIIKLYLHL
ncbi:MAG: helix-hairpin-helix domain-containing protein [Winogradskyella sp.]|uniref:ComEA family DNA-binding protein n=1 Tax=Winogradskyella sp. TaxID=1883156 RepID=UPI0017C46874|nr:helix-hairpin-helix domain-containing protein [Winogradskyella sp.]